MSASKQKRTAATQPPKISMILAVVFPFLGLVFAIVQLWTVGLVDGFYLALFFGGWIATGLGITVGYHRLLTHRSFDTYPWVRACWAFIGSLAVQGSPLYWCAVHRKHHELSDKPGDPHSPHQHGEGFWNSLYGLYHSHVGWLFGDTWTKNEMERYIPDLMREPSMVFVHRFYFLWVVVSLTLPAAIAGIVYGTWTAAFLGLVWGGLARVFFVHHVTWSINSICHTFGKRDFETTDLSRNNVICGILGHGEGWHNNHHAFPTSARHGLKWWQFDTSWLVIRTLQAFGLAWNLRTPAAKLIEAKLISEEINVQDEPLYDYTPEIEPYLDSVISEEIEETELVEQ